MTMKRIGLFTLVGALAVVGSGCTCRTVAVATPESPNVPVVDSAEPLNDINFAFDSYKIDAGAKDILVKNVKWLQGNPTKKVQIEGHCDERGTNEYNMVLGANRARAAFDFMKSQGIEASRMSTVSYGEELPVDPRHNEEAWAKNRRDHFKVN
jgi:peptidoglycan-associated lipoprotein